MSAAASLFVGRTVHERRTPTRRRFAYRLASVWLDVDRLDEAAGQSRLFSVDRFNLFSFHRRDHGARRSEPLRPWAEAVFAEAGVSLDGGPVRLFCLPRVLGYVFNPLSLWFGYGPDGAARGVIYEVRNTFGDVHAYAAPLDGAAGALHRHDAEKIFHVSPFWPVAGRYAFTLRAEAERLALSIRYRLDDADVFTATQTAARRVLDDRGLLGVFFGQPLLTLKVIAGIHLEALRIWRGGGRYHRRPEPPPLISVARRRALRVADPAL